MSAVIISGTAVVPGVMCSAQILIAVRGNEEVIIILL